MLADASLPSYIMVRTRHFIRLWGVDRRKLRQTLLQKKSLSDRSAAELDEIHYNTERKLLFFRISPQFMEHVWLNYSYHLTLCSVQRFVC